MKTTKKLFLTFLLCSCISFAQSTLQRAKIIKENNQVALLSLASELEEKAILDSEKAIEYAKKNGISIFKENEDGSFDQLMRVTDTGIPVYYTLDNVAAAVSTRADRLHQGGSLGLNIEGQGMTAYVWDGGALRSDHVEFNNGGSLRATIGDGAGALNDNSFHATHVSGTIAASGTNNPNSKGMAPKATVVGNDWNSDNAEMARAASAGALISNHSYGVPVRSFTSQAELIGKYTGDAQAVDQITFNAPYYLPVYSAGNDGGTLNPSPLFNNSGFDKLTTDKVAKNIVVVANAQDALINVDGSLNSVIINGGSSQGPTDDLRVKPDISGNGTQLLSTFDGSPTDYGTISGTSMAAPNVAGSLLLLQQYYEQLNGKFMRSSTLRALALHTADDAGPVGPDPVYGWGLMNTQFAAETIEKDAFNSRIVEAELAQGETYSITVEAEGTEDLLASIAWIDPAGEVNSGLANDMTPALVNDLDIRISQNGVSFDPWKLVDLNAAIKGDNLVDNFERVEVSNPAGDYTITVTHKGTLQGGSQKFSLVVTGEVRDFSVKSNTQILELCNDQDATFPIEFLTRNDFSGIVNLSLDGVPNGATATLSQNSFSSSGFGSLVLTDLSNTASGTYLINVHADLAGERRTVELQLSVFNSTLLPVNVIFPLNQETEVSDIPILRWDQDVNAQFYELEISQFPSFIISTVNETVNGSSFVVPNGTLNANTTYYWRVRPVNTCLSGAFQSQSFTTFNCQRENASIPSPISIPDNNPAGISSSVVVNQNLIVEAGKISVRVQITHEFSGDLAITLTSPDGTTVALAGANGCETDDINVTFENGAGRFFCRAETPGYFGRVVPLGDLSDFNGENVNGTWTLNVADVGPDDLGTLTAWTLNFCEEPTVLSNEDLEIVDFSIFPNPSNGLFQVTGLEGADLNNTQVSIFDLNGRRVFTQKVDPSSNQLNETIDVQNLSNGLYLLQVQNGASIATKKIIIKK